MKQLQPFAALQTLMVKKIFKQIERKHAVNVSGYFVIFY